MNDVTTLQLMLWVVFPYMVLAVFVLGHVWRFRADRFGWTTRSSQIYESKLLSIGSPMFHYGIIGIFFGHVVGLGIPKSWTRFLGISDHVYHLMAVTIGLAAAVACVGGLLILLYRRRTQVVVGLEGDRAGEAEVPAVLSAGAGHRGVPSGQGMGVPTGCDYATAAGAGVTSVADRPVAR